CGALGPSFRSSGTMRATSLRAAESRRDGVGRTAGLRSESASGAYDKWPAAAAHDLCRGDSLAAAQDLWPRRFPGDQPRRSGLRKSGFYRYPAAGEVRRAAAMDSTLRQMQRLANHVAIVTGGAQGIGGAAARRLAA